MLKKNIFAAVTMLLGGIIILSSCGDKTSPGWEYMPDMYRGPAVETYSDSLGALKPVEGTIPRGFVSYEKLPNTPEGYEASKTALRFPEDMKMDSLSISEATILYGVFCGHCHGTKGDGNGILMEREKFLGIPSYADRDINVGSVFYVITNGKGMMGSHASQLTPEERWKVAKYVMELKRELSGGTVEEAGTDAESEAPAPEEEVAEPSTDV